VSDKPEFYWRPQVLRHINARSEEFAIHEVYFSDFGNECGLTADAVSSRYTSVKKLKVALEEFIVSNLESIHCGDLNYEYFREDVNLWLKHINDPVLDCSND